MEELLYINGQRVDLLPRSVSRTLQINDFREIRNRQANYSNQIKLPLTANNIEVFDLIGVQGNTSTAPYSSLSVTYYLDGIQLISGGKGVLKKTDQFLNLVIYDGNIDLQTLLGDSRLQDLDFTAYNHTLDYDEFFNSMTTTSGYIYALKGGARVDIHKTPPLFYTHTLISMIFTQAGWTISGDLLTDTNYLKDCISMKKGMANAVSGSLTQVYTSTNIDPHTYSDVTGTIDEILIDSYTTTSTAVHRIELDGNFIVNRSYDNEVDLLIKVNGTIVGQVFNLTDGEEIGGVFSIGTTSGDIITTYVKVRSALLAPSEYYYSVQESFTSRIYTDTQGITITFEDIIGDMRQIDLVKSVIQDYNVMIRKTSATNLELKLGKSILNETTIDDWTDKFSDIISETYAPNYAQNNQLLYNYDENEESFADGVLIVTNQNLPEIKVILQSPFKVLQNISDRLNNYYPWGFYDANGDPVENGYYKVRVTTEASIVTNYRLRDTDAYVESTETIAYTDIADLDYQSIIADYFTEFQDVLDKYKKVEANVYLTLFDVRDIDFFKPKFFKQTGRKYYLNKILNFRNNRITKVELIEIPVTFK